MINYMYQESNQSDIFWIMSVLGGYAVPWRRNILKTNPFLYTFTGVTLPKE